MEANAKITAIVVDDEKSARSVLIQTIEETQLLKIVGEASSVPEAVKLINRLKPELVFLDIEMPGYSGLQLLEFFNENEITFDIIFVTAYNEYAINAFKLSAFDYLLKPVDEDEVEATLNRYVSQRGKSRTTEQAALLKEAYTKDKTLSRIAVASTYGVDFIEVDQIVYLEAKNNYTEIYRADGSKITASKTLSDFESLLMPSGFFFRTHRTYLINLREVSRLNAKDGLYIELKSGAEIPLSRYRRKDFEDLFEKFKV